MSTTRLISLNGHWRAGRGPLIETMNPANGSVIAAIAGVILPHRSGPPL
ncbi:MAG: hypothetical protein AAF999_16605 [Pseudomonadota bacterium]